MNNLKKTLTEKISNTIETKKIKPTPRGIFVVRRLIIWIVLAISIIISAATLSMIIFRASKLRSLPYENLPAPLSSQFLDMVPVIFIITLIIGIVIAIYEFGKTDKGYKFEKTKVTLSLVGCVAVLAAIFSYTGVHHSIHRFMVEHSKLAPTVEEIKNRRFNNPDRGIIRGIVKEQILTNKSGREVKLIRGQNINNEDFSSIDGFEQPVILFGKLVTDGFIVCKLSRPEKKVGFKFKKLDEDAEKCKKALK